MRHSWLALGLTLAFLPWLGALIGAVCQERVEPSRTNKSTEDESWSWHPSRGLACSSNQPDRKDHTHQTESLYRADLKDKTDRTSKTYQADHRVDRRIKIHKTYPKNWTYPTYRTDHSTRTDRKDQIDRSINIHQLDHKEQAKQSAQTVRQVNKNTDRIYRSDNAVKKHLVDRIDIGIDIDRKDHIDRIYINDLLNFTVRSEKQLHIDKTVPTNLFNASDASNNADQSTPIAVTLQETEVKGELHNITLIIGLVVFGITILFIIIVVSVCAIRARSRSTDQTWYENYGT